MSEAWKNDNTLRLVMEKIGADYELLDFLGVGGYARIYKFRHRPPDQIRTLKIMDFEYILRVFKKEGTPGIRQEFERISERFMNEAGIYRKLSHPGIVKIYAEDFVSAPYEKEKIEIPYMILEYIEGTTLKEVLKNDPSWNLKNTFTLCEDVLSALDMIHNAGIIHRDIKPSNIMIRKETGAAVLIDFGLARDIDNLITKSQEFMGTITYSSPEMLKNSKDISLETDLYSFGVVLYEMITGALPFTGSQADIVYGHLNIVKSIPGEVFPRDYWFLDRINRIVKKAMAKEVENRYRSAREFLTDLKKLGHDLGDIQILHQRKIKPTTPPQKTSEAFDPNELLNQVFMDRYEVKEITGYQDLFASRGHVFKVYDREDKIHKAVKVFDPGYSATAQAREEIKNEFETAKKMGHIHFVKVYHLEEGHLTYMIMEYIEGENLKKKLEKMPDHKFEEIRALAIMNQVLSALIEAHKKQVMHNTLNLGNIMLDRQGNIKIINFREDLQLKKHLEKLEEMISGSGDWRYIPPENHPDRWEERKMQTDIWAFGVTLFRLLTGKEYNPKPGQTQPGILPGISAKTKQVLEKCLDANPVQRYKDFNEISGDFPGKGREEQTGKAGENHDQERKSAKIKRRWFHLPFKNSFNTP